VKVWPTEAGLATDLFSEGRCAQHCDVDVGGWRRDKPALVERIPRCGRRFELTRMPAAFATFPNNVGMARPVKAGTPRFP
jgi:hypothetical protein